MGLEPWTSYFEFETQPLELREVLVQIWNINIFNKTGESRKDGEVA